MNPRIQFGTFCKGRLAEPDDDPETITVGYGIIDTMRPTLVSHDKAVIEKELEKHVALIGHDTRVQELIASDNPFSVLNNAGTLYFGWTSESEIAIEFYLADVVKFIVFKGEFTGSFTRINEALGRAFERRLRATFRDGRLYLREGGRRVHDFQLAGKVKEIEVSPDTLAKLVA